MIPLLPFGIVRLNLRLLRIVLPDLLCRKIRPVMPEYRELVLVLFYQFVDEVRVHFLDSGGGGSALEDCLL